MTMNNVEITAALQNIADRLAGIETRLDKPQAHTASGGATAAGEVASDAELDDKFGDPIVKYDPKRWKGESYAGKHMSECPSGYLEEVASFNEWRAATFVKEGKDPKWPTLDARRARGWKARNADKSFAQAPVADAAGNYDADMGDPDIPF